MNLKILIGPSFSNFPVYGYGILSYIMVSIPALIFLDDFKILSL